MFAHLNHCRTTNHRKRFSKLLLSAAALAACLIAAALVVGAPAGVPQASITLNGSDVALCHHNTTEWELTKVVTGHLDGGEVVWTVTATRGETTDDILSVNGFVAVKNTGSAPATIGNIVVNLQRKSGSKWKSASVDVADATNGDAAITANVVASATDTLAGFNYVVTAPQGTFTENAASGSLEFTDVDSNTIWAITPQQSIPPGATVNLLFSAEFNNSLLGIPAGEQVRAEVIVSFGNSGARGGSGSSANNIDVNGNGVIDTDEANVRSVPTRITRTVPALEECNDEVLLTDTGLSTTGTVTYENADLDGYDGAGVLITATTTFTVTASGVDGGEDGGTIGNTATLVASSDGVSIVIGYDIDGQPITYTFVCCPGLDLSASDTEPIGSEKKTFITYTQGGYQGNGVPGQLLIDNFATLFPVGLTIGTDDGAGPMHSAKWTDISKLRSWLGGGGPSGALTADTLNATSTSGGTLAKQTATLTINIAIGGINANYPAGFGDLVFHEPGSSLDGATVDEILDIANGALGGDGFPVGYTPGNLNTLITNLNEAFDNGTETAWAVAHLE